MASTWKCLTPYFGDALQKAIVAGQLPQIRLDDIVTRIATSMFQAGLFDRPPRGSLGDNVASDAHDTCARRAASEGTVLLKNEASLLPFTTARVHSIAVIGDAASNSPVTVGGGSGWVRAPHIVTPLQGIRARAPASMTVDYSSSSLDCARRTPKNRSSASVTSSPRAAGDFLSDGYIGGDFPL